MSRSFRGAFAEFADAELRQRLHEALIETTRKDSLIGHVQIAAAGKQQVLQLGACPPLFGRTQPGNLSAGRRRKWISHAPPGSRTIHASFRTAGPERWKDSSDGHGIETQAPTINARHDSNYFGLKKGVSSYTLVANHVLAF
jgi:hypothetical protein